MKDDLPYFTHDNDARNHAKMKALRARFGWSGYGQFWALNEMIAGSANAMLDLSRKVVRSGVACELGMTTDALESFLDFLSDVDECGLVHYEDGIVYTDRTQENFEKVNGDRCRKRGFGVRSAENRRNGAEKTQISVEKVNILNETKLNETKLKEKEEEPSRSSDTSMSDLAIATRKQIKEMQESSFFSEPVSNISEPRQAGCTRIESAKESWNYLALTPFRYSAFQIRPDDMTEIMRTLSVYDDAAIKQAIQNYGEISRTKSLELKPAYPSGFIGFMKSGVDKYTDEAKPFERCKKPQMAMTPQEKHDAGVAEAKALSEKIKRREALQAELKAKK